MTGSALAVPAPHPNGRPAGLCSDGPCLGSKSDYAVVCTKWCRQFTKIPGSSLSAHSDYLLQTNGANKPPIISWLLSTQLLKNIHIHHKTVGLITNFFPSSLGMYLLNLTCSTWLISSSSLNLYVCSCAYGIHLFLPIPISHARLLYMDAGDANSGPQACTVCTFPSESTPYSPPLSNHRNLADSDSCALSLYIYGWPCVSTSSSHTF